MLTVFNWSDHVHVPTRYLLINFFICSLFIIVICTYRTSPVAPGKYIVSVGARPDGVGECDDGRPRPGNGKGGLTSMVSKCAS